MMDSDIERLPTLSQRSTGRIVVQRNYRANFAPDYIELAKVAFGHFLFKPEDLKEQEHMSKQETALYLLTQQSEKTH